MMTRRMWCAPGALMVALWLGWAGSSAAAQQGEQVRRQHSGRPSRAAPDAPKRERGRSSHAVAGRQRKEVPPAMSPAPTVRLDTVVYRLALSADKAVALDSAKLGRQTTLADFEKRLRSLGDARLLYRIDQTVNLRDQARIYAQADQPLAPAAASSGGKRRVPSGRRTTGIELSVGGDWAAGAAGRLAMLSLRVDVATVETVSVGQASSSPLFRDVRQNYMAPTRYEQPIVLVSLDGNCGDAQGRCVAFITRVVLHAPETFQNRR